jgi:outer membrane protein assembly factor BamA
VTGRAANIGGTVGWGPAQQRSAYLEIPTRIVGLGQLKLQASSQLSGVQSSIGSLAGTKLQLQRQQVQVSLAKVINPQWTYNLNTQFLNDTHQTTTKGYIAPDGHFTFVSANIGRRVGTNASASQFSLTIGTLLTPQGDSLPRLTSSVDVKRPITANMQISAGVGGGYQNPTTPLTYQYRLGGSRTLRGYGATITPQRMDMRLSN